MKNQDYIVDPCLVEIIGRNRDHKKRMKWKPGPHDKCVYLDKYFQLIAAEDIEEGDYLYLVGGPQEKRKTDKKRQVHKRSA